MRQVISSLAFDASVLVALFTLSLPVAMAQQPVASQSSSVTSSAASTASPDSSQKDERYRIGPGDVLDIRVFNRPQLSRESVRVDERGMIRMPLLEDDIQAGCRTEGELALEIATHYLKYQRNPHVDVFIKEYNSQPVAVIGAVNKPGQFQLQRRVRLLELLSFAGGHSEKAGGRINIIRAPGVSLCERQATVTPDENLSEGFISYNLSDTLQGKANPFVRPGDVITLIEAEQVFVVGNVYRPSAIALKEPVTVSGAIAMSGGVLPATKSEKIRIIRQVPGSMNKTEIAVDLNAIKKHQAQDIALQAGDIVEVPTSTGKSVLRSLAGIIAPTASMTAIQVIR